MKLVYCVCFVGVLLMLSEGKAWTTGTSAATTRISENTTTTTTPAPVPARSNTPATETPALATSREPKPTTKAPPKPTTTTRAPPKPTTRLYPTTARPGPGVNLRGKMVTLSQTSDVKFYPPHYHSAPAEGEEEHLKTIKIYPWRTTTTTSPATRGVSVCLRYLCESTSQKLFTLSPYSSLSLSFSVDNTLTTTGYYYWQVVLGRVAFLWPWVQTQPWTSVCVVLDSLKNVVQVFEGGAMSMRKRSPSGMVWSRDPVLDMSGFDGQVTDLEVWDYPLQYREILGYMQNYGSSGTVLTWSNIAYTFSRDVLVEDTYTQQMRRPISSSKGEQPPIRSGQGRDRRLKYRKKLSEKRQMF